MILHIGTSIDYICKTLTNNMKRSKYIIIVLVLIIISIGLLFGINMLRKPKDEPVSGVFAKTELLYKDGSDKPFTGTVRETETTNIIEINFIKRNKIDQFS